MTLPYPKSAALSQKGVFDRNGLSDEQMLAKIVEGVLTYLPQESNARLICNRYTGGAIKPEAMWSMMKYLRSRIISLIKEGSITNKEETEILEYLLRTKKWNPYCIRHSSITSDSDYLPEYALKKKSAMEYEFKARCKIYQKKNG